MRTKPVNIVEAEDRGYAPVTDPYTPQEADLLDRAVRDLEGCDYLLVKTSEGVSIYRKRSEVNKFQAFPI